MPAIPDAVDAGKLADAGEVSDDAGCSASAGFVCGGYAFSYTELKGLKVSVGQGHATAPGVAMPNVSGLGTEGCAQGLRTVATSSGHGTFEGESDFESTFERVNLRKQAATDPAVEAYASRILPTDLTRTFELAVSRGDRTETMRFESGPDPSGQCGDTYVWSTRATHVFDVIVTARFPDAASLERFSEYSLMQALSTWSPDDTQKAAEAALAVSGAQVELHVAASGDSHDEMRETLESSTCRGDAPAECRATIAALNQLASESAAREEWTTVEFRTRPYEP